MSGKIEPLDILRVRGMASCREEGVEDSHNLTVDLDAVHTSQYVEHVMGMAIAERIVGFKFDTLVSDECDSALCGVVAQGLLELNREKGVLTTQLDRNTKLTNSLVKDKKVIIVSQTCAGIDRLVQAIHLNKGELVVVAVLVSHDTRLVSDSARVDQAYGAPLVSVIEIRDYVGSHDCPICRHKARVDEHLLVQSAPLGALL